MISVTMKSVLQHALRRVVHDGHGAVFYYLGAVCHPRKDGDLMGANWNVVEAVQYLYLRLT